jgi:hypothetical protein
MKWVTWENVGIDRIGCAWLIRKHIDPKAKFLFIPVGTVAVPEGAEPFDIPGVRLSHIKGTARFTPFSANTRSPIPCCTESLASLMRRTPFRKHLWSRRLRALT